MHRSQLGGFIIDCQTADLDGAARFWSAALGLPTRASPEAKYIGLETAPNGLAIEVQKVDHPSRVHLDLREPSAAAETIPADVHEDSIEPGLEPIDITQRAPRAPRSLGGVVDRVLGLEPVGKDDRSAAIGAVQRRADEPPEGVCTRSRPAMGLVCRVRIGDGQAPVWRKVHRLLYPLASLTIRAHRIVHPASISPWQAPAARP